MDAKSVILFPAYPAVLPGKGFYEIRGLAWSGRGRITRVDVSVDVGRHWEAAPLQEPVLPKCHTPFRYLWNWKGGDTLVMSRATDETGYVQPTLAELRRARGAGPFTPSSAWRVTAPTDAATHHRELLALPDHPLRLHQPVDAPGRPGIAAARRGL